MKKNLIAYRKLIIDFLALVFLIIIARYCHEMTRDEDAI